MQHSVRASNIDAAHWADRRVLITGHSGFKGAWLALWLQHLGARVSGVAPGPPTSPSFYELAGVGGRLSAHRADVRDYESLGLVLAQERPEVVFHLAAQPIVRRSLSEPRATYEINVMGTVNLLAAVRSVPGVRSVVVVTSDKAYANPGGRAERRNFVEDDPVGGGDPYSSSKACAELVTAAFRSSYFSDAAGPRVATARPGNVIGGGDWGEERLIPGAIRAAESGEVLRVSQPDAVRPWQHVLNPLSGYLILAQRLHRGDDVDEAWNFGPDPEDARPVRWIVERLAQLWPEGLRFELEDGGGPGDAGFLSLDSTKAAERLGWTPPWNLDDALARVVEWHQACRRGEDMRQVSLEQIEQFARAESVRA